MEIDWVVDGGELSLEWMQKCVGKIGGNGVSGVLKLIKIC